MSIGMQPQVASSLRLPPGSASCQVILKAIASHASTEHTAVPTFPWLCRLRTLTTEVALLQLGREQQNWLCFSLADPYALAVAVHSAQWRLDVML